MIQKRLYTNIFTPEAKEYLLKISGPRAGEMERVKKDVFQKLETRYPQFRHRGFFSVENVFKNRSTFGFSLFSVICIVIIIFYSQIHRDSRKEPTELGYQATVSPSETALVKRPDQNELVVAVDNNSSATAFGAVTNEQKVKLQEKAQQVAVIDHTNAVNKQTDEVTSITNVKNTQQDVQANSSSRQPAASIARNEGSVISAAQYTSPGLPPTQLEYFVSINH